MTTMVLPVDAESPFDVALGWSGGDDERWKEPDGEDREPASLRGASEHSGSGGERDPGPPRLVRCADDPAVNRSLLELDSGSRLLAPVGAGCNVLDYLLDGPERIDAYPERHAEPALLELKVALIQRGWRDDLWRLFGCGAHSGYRPLLALLDDDLGGASLRRLSAWARYFEPANGQRTFHFHGPEGTAAWVLRGWLRRRRPDLWEQVVMLDGASSLDEQRSRFGRLGPELMPLLASWLAHRRAPASLGGAVAVESRRDAVGCPSNLVRRVEARLRHLAATRLLRDNYFWRVAIRGRYGAEGCPNYLRPENFETLRGRSSRIHLLPARGPGAAPRAGRYTHVVLEGHQDWLAAADPAAMAERWRRVLSASHQGTRILFRTSGGHPDGLPAFARAALRFLPERSMAAGARDRTAGLGGIHLAVVR